MARTTAPRHAPAPPRVAKRRGVLAASRDERQRAIDTQERGSRSVSSLELGLVEMPTRPHSVYTMAQRRDAINEADSGIFRAAADITLAAITEDAYARGILKDLTEGMWGLRKHFVGRPDLIADLDDTPDRVGQFRTMFPDADSIRLMSWGVSLGMAPGQMRRKYGARPSYDYPVSPEEATNWKATKAASPRIERPIGAFDTRILRAWSPKWLRCEWWNGPSWFLTTADGEIRISQLDDPATSKDEFGNPIRNGNPDEWILYTPYGEVEPWKWGTWVSATLAFVAARDATFDRLRHLQILAPVRVGKVPAGTTETQRKKYARLLQEAKRMAMYVLPPGLEYDIVECKGRVHEIYADVIAWSERQYAMQSGVLTTATGNAGFAKGDVQERYSRAILSFLASSLATCFHAPMRAWSREEHDTEDAPRVGWDTEAPEDKKARAETLKSAGEGIVAIIDSGERAGLRLTKASLIKEYQKLGFEVEDMPHLQAKAAKIDLAPTDKALVFRAREVRAGEGVGPLGTPENPDARDDMLIAELRGLAKGTHDAAPNADNAQPIGDDEVASSVPQTDEAIAYLADKMTAHGVERCLCRNSSPNKCVRCGIERVRDFYIDKKGNVIPTIAWRPIVRSAVAAMSAGSNLPSRVYSGIRVRIDRPKGYVQTGVGSNGQPWERVYLVDYGFIDGTRGGDGEEFDVFCGPDRFAPQAFVAMQTMAGGKFDEYKLFLGFASIEDARACYVAHIPMTMLAGMFSMPVEAIRGFLGLEPRAKHAIALVRASEVAQ